MFGSPALITRASGCRVWDPDGREYVDYVMALGAVALGYGHPAVNRAAEAAIAAGVVGPLPPVAEQQLAEALAERIPWLERVRFLKTGAEAAGAGSRRAGESAREWIPARRGGRPGGSHGRRGPHLDLIDAGDRRGGARSCARHAGGVRP